MARAKIAYGVYNQLDRISNVDLYLRVKGSTLFYLERLSKKLVVWGQRPLEIFCGDTIHNVLSTALSNGFTHCVMLAAGCQIRSYSFAADIEEFVNVTEFGVAGHPLLHPDGRWLELHHQFFIVNLKAWNEVGKPDFGMWEYDPKLLPVLERSEENFHDDYTPLWIKATGKHAMQPRAGQGWKLTSAMFDGGYEVVTLPEKIRFNKFYTYPEADTDNYLERIKTLTVDKSKNWNQNKWITDSITVKDQIWLFNSENLHIDNNGTYDIVVSPASGFKIFDFFRVPRLTSNAKIIIYDFNPKSIAWYKHFHTWHNENLLECINAFPDKNNFTWLGQTNSTFEENSAFTKLFRENINHTGGEEKFKEFWRMFKNSNVEFHELDLYKEPEGLAKLLVGPGKKFVNLTNIFSTDATQLIFGHPECMAAQYKCLGYIFVADPETDITIFDFWGRYKFGPVKDIL